LPNMRMTGETLVQDVGRSGQTLFNGSYDRMTRNNAVVTEEHFPEQGPGAGGKFLERLPRLEHFPAFHLSEALWGERGSQAGDKHERSLALDR
jgi:hypothetical protein